MKHFFQVFALIAALQLCRASAYSQAIDPQKSASAEANADTRLITSSISDNEDIIFLSKQATERAGDSRVRELAAQLMEDNSSMLFSMQQLQTAGTGSSTQGLANSASHHPQAADLNGRLSGVSGGEYDTMWVSNIVSMQQAKLDQLTQAKETVRNPQLRMVITEAIPVIKKDLTQLKSVQKYLIKTAIQKKKEAARNAQTK